MKYNLFVYCEWCNMFVSVSISCYILWACCLYWEWYKPTTRLFAVELVTVNQIPGTDILVLWDFYVKLIIPSLLPPIELISTSNWSTTTTDCEADCRQILVILHLQLKKWYFSSKHRTARKWFFPMEKRSLWSNSIIKAINPIYFTPQYSDNNNSRTIRTM